jgi:hypothetical protein
MQRAARGLERAAIAFVVSPITAFVAVKSLLGYIRTHRFTAFAVHLSERIAPGELLAAPILRGGRPRRLDRITPLHRT